MTSTINASSTGSGGIVQTADASGVLALQANGTTAFTVNSDATTTFASAANLPNTFGFKNRIINGNMTIDQRNAGTSVTLPATTSQYTLDRWAAQSSGASKYSIQRNAGSITLPAGFTNYLGVTSLAATTLASTDYYDIFQCIEGYNIADLAWGTANAATVTLSFRVYSSLTGTFSGSLRNISVNRSYVFTYSIPTANTWTTISVTIAGDTSGTWATDNTQGIYVSFSLGIGSNYSGTAGSWSANNYLSATGSVSVVGTSGATFYITGVQLEKGSVATSFDFRPYTTELQLCQRYFCSSFIAGTAVADGVVAYLASSATAYTTSNSWSSFMSFPVTMRIAPAITGYKISGLGATIDFRLDSRNSFRAQESQSDF